METSLVTLEEVHASVAVEFARVIREALKTEESLEESHKNFFPSTKFHRTDHSGMLLNRLLNNAWNHNELVRTTGFTKTSQDTHGVVRALHSILDYNLYTQVYCNMMPFLATLDLKAMEIAVEKVHQDLISEVGADPLKWDAKRQKAASIHSWYKGMEDLKDLAQLHKSFSKEKPTIGGFCSYRLSPIGTTPTFTDKYNWSRLSPKMDNYVRMLGGSTEDHLSYIVFDPQKQLAMAEALIEEYKDDDSIKFKGIDDLYTSKSGNPDILKKCMVVRKKMADIIGLYSHMHFTIAPRMESIMIMDYRLQEMDLSSVMEDGMELRKSSRMI